MIRVHMIDEKFKSFAIDENASVEQLRTAVIEKLELVVEDSFALFEKRDDVGMQYSSSLFNCFNFTHSKREMFGT